MTSAAEFQTKVTKTGVNMDRLDGIVNGGPTVVVTTDNGDVPSLANMLANLGIVIPTVGSIAARDTFYAIPANQSKLVYVNNNNGSADDPANGVYEYVSGAPRIAQGFYAGLSAVVQPLVAEAQAAAASAAASAALFAENYRPSTNLADPARTDPSLASASAQTSRSWANNAGAPLAAQSPTTLGQFAALKRLPVTAGQTYTINLNGAVAGVFFYFPATAFISFFNADRSWNSAITSGFTRSADNRTVTFTAPTGAAYVAFTVRDATHFSNTSPITAAAVSAIEAALVLNAGSQALPYEAPGTQFYDPSGPVGTGTDDQIATKLDATGLTDVRALFVTATSDNIYLPNTGAALPVGALTPANYNTGGSTGTTLNNFATSGLIPVTPGGIYTVNINGAVAGATLSRAQGGTFYNADYSFNQNLAQNGTTMAFSADNRSVTFTAPAGVAFVGFNITQTAAFTAPTFAAVLASLMVNIGATALPYEAPVDPNMPLLPGPAFGQAEASSASPVVVVRDGIYTYVRAPKQMSPDKDIVRKLLTGEVPAYTSAGIATKSGAVDFVGARTIARSNAPSQTVAAFNASTLVDSYGGDERTPVHINGVYIGGGHGGTGYEGTKTAHGLTTANIGAVASDGTRNWVLVYIVSADKAFWMAEPTGAADKWSIYYAAAPSSTLTWVSGGANFGAISGWAWALELGFPILRGLAITTHAGDTEVTADGVYTGQCRIEQSYDILNPASLLTYLKANIGSTDYKNVAVASQVGRFMIFDFDEYGARTVQDTEIDYQAYTRVAGAPGDYNGAMQWQRPPKTGDTPVGLATAVKLYVPDITPVSGFDFQSKADFTANAAFISIPKSSCADPTNPASHFAIFGFDAGGNQVSGYAFGYSRTIGQTTPAARAANVTNVHQLAGSGKQYPVAVDWAAGDAVAGAVRTTVAWDAFFDPTDADLTLPAVGHAEPDGQHYFVITAHKAISGKWVTLPDAMKGKRVAVVKAGAGVSVGPLVTPKGVWMSNTGAYGDVVIGVG